MKCSSERGLPRGVQHIPYRILRLPSFPRGNKEVPWLPGKNAPCVKPVVGVTCLVHHQAI